MPHRKLKRPSPASPAPARVGVGVAHPFLNVVDLPIWGLPQDPLSPVVLDLRRDHGEGDFVDKVRAAVDGGEVIALWDPEDEWPSFAVGRRGGTYYARGADGVTRGAFITIEMAMKFGLTTKQEGEHGRP